MDERVDGVLPLAPRDGLRRLAVLVQAVHFPGRLQLSHHLDLLPLILDDLYRPPDLLVRELIFEAVLLRERLQEDLERSNQRRLSLEVDFEDMPENLNVLRAQERLLLLYLGGTFGLV